MLNIGVSTVLIIAIIILILFFARMASKRSKRKAALYKDFAKKNSLNYQYELDLINIENELSGELNGFPFHLSEFINKESLTTTVSIGNSPHTFQFRIGVKKLLGKFIPSTHIKEVTFANPNWSKLIFHSEDEAAFLTLFNSQIQTEFEAIQTIFEGELTNSNGHLTYEFEFGLSTKKQFEEFELLLTFFTRLLKH